ncbi:MAG: multicopper oxidase domain-containing protein [Terracidiphilus sp.]
MKNCLLVFALVSLAAAHVGAQSTTPAPRAFSDPADLSETRAGKQVEFNLDIGYTLVHTYNPATGKTDEARLRTYNGNAVGPTMRVLPGDTLHGFVHNNLPHNLLGCADGPDHNVPHCFNTTNLHTHGLHVSPKGISDNVFINIEPGGSQEYKVELPANHPAGTFWYHSHRHGSTALQVSSGMEGALIVEGHRTYADKQAHGGLADIDTVLKQAGGRKVEDHIALFQQVQYSCREPDGTFTWDCGATDGGKQRVGMIEDYSAKQFGFSTWVDSGRYTTINGAVQPTVPAVAGDIYRFRLIHGGVRDSIGLHITAAKTEPRGNLLAATLSAGVGAKDQPKWIEDHCNMKATVPQFEIAADGLTRTAMYEKPINVIQPGYRSDVLVVFPHKGLYCVTNDVFNPAGEINPQELTPEALRNNQFIPREPRLLALIEVTGDTTVDLPHLREYLGKELYDGNPELPEPVRTQLKALNTAEFSPMPDLRGIKDVEHTTTVFDIEVPPAVPKDTFEVDGHAYEPDHYKKLTLGKVEEWDITSKLGNHPYHIHVNPFQVVAIYDPDGKSIFDAQGHCTEMDKTKVKPNPDPQYCDQIGVFRDTILIKKGYHVVVRSHYEDFAGDFVLHCHILDHEDEGMMQNIRIVDPANPDTSPFSGDMAHGHH